MKRIVEVMIGAGIGFMIGYFGHCASGTCPLTGNPWVSTIMGAFIGYMKSSGFIRK